MLQMDDYYSLIQSSAKEQQSRCWSYNPIFRNVAKEAIPKSEILPFRISPVGIYDVKDQQNSYIQMTITRTLA
ncbi:MAG: hypothetical protein Ta2E_01220 [Mycoplasmoidaceae bacterium]|nr:MAG: hypothetical protein Ta2E_01220 [Mycoplasmoidaceae bacterium]